jgi:hypothetical protein
MILQPLRLGADHDAAAALGCSDCRHIIRRCTSSPLIVAVLCVCTRAGCCLSSVALRCDVCFDLAHNSFLSHKGLTQRHPVPLDACTHARVPHGPNMDATYVARLTEPEACKVQHHQHQPTSAKKTACGAPVMPAELMTEPAQQVSCCGDTR